MQFPLPPDVQDLIAAQLATGRYQSEEDVLREALRGLQEASDNAAAVQDAIDAWREGDDGLPMDQAFDLIRNEFLGKSTA